MIDVKTLKKGDVVYYYSKNLNAIIEYEYLGDHIFSKEGNKKRVPHNILIHLYYSKDEAIIEYIKSSLNSLNKLEQDQKNILENTQRKKENLLKSEEYKEMFNKYPEEFL